MEDDLVNSAAAKGWSLGQAADRLCDKQRALALAGRVSNESQTCAACSAVSKVYGSLPITTGAIPICG
jgi:hypothetical protein